MRNDNKYSLNVAVEDMYSGYLFLVLIKTLKNAENPRGISVYNENSSKK